jgi:hypothetical protein
VTLVWREKTAAGVIGHEIDVGPSGLRYVRTTSSPTVYLLPVDPAFDAALASLLTADAGTPDAHAGSARPTAPAAAAGATCGAPLAGTLTVGSSAPLDLADPGLWRRYGDLARLLASRVTVKEAAPMDVGCTSLTLSDALAATTASATSAASPPSATTTAPAATTFAPVRDPQALLGELDGTRISDAGRDTVLLRLAEGAPTPGDDFYGLELLRLGEGSGQASVLVSDQLPSMVREVGTPEQARELLARVAPAATAGPEAATHAAPYAAADADYERALLDLAAEDFAGAADAMRAFYDAQDRDDIGTKRAAEMTTLGDDAALADAETDPKGQRPTALLDLALRYEALAREVGGDDPATAAPLAILFYYRATRYARRVARRSDDNGQIDDGSRILVAYHGAVAAHEQVFDGSVRARTELAAQYLELMSHSSFYGAQPGWSTLESPEQAIAREVYIGHVRGVETLLANLPSTVVPAALRAAAHAYAEIGRPDLAADAAQRAGSPAAASTTSDGTDENADGVADDLADAPSATAVAVANASIVLQASGHPTAAAVERDHARTLAQDDPASLLAIGRVFLSHASAATATAARDALSRALDLEPGNANAWLERARADLAMGDARAALRDASAARQAGANPTDADRLERNALLLLPPPIPAPPPAPAPAAVARE